MEKQIYPTMESYQKALELIVSSVEGEKSDAMFYDWLINNIPMNGLTSKQVQEISDTIKGIKEDEIAHNKTFKSMYKELTGKEVTPPEDEIFEEPSSFIEGIKKALMGELNAVKKYRTIMAGLPGNYYRDQVFNILTDELRHGSLYNFIYATVIEED